MREPISWSRRLDVRFAALTAGLVAAAAAVLVVLGLRAQERHVLLEAVRSAALLSETVKSSTHLHMLQDRRQDAYAVMENIGRQEGIESVRIFNKEGRVTFSTRRPEIGSLVDKRAESCYACHAAGQPIVRPALSTRSRTYRTAQGDRVLAMVTPIYNEPSCSTAACHEHPASQRVLGVVDVGLSLGEIDASLAALQRRTAIVATGGLVLLAAAAGFVAHRRVVRPLAEIVGGTHLVAEGDLRHRLPVHDGDEIGLLAKSFNAMTDSLAEARAQRQALLESLERQVEERTAALKEAQAALVRTEKLASLGQLSASIAHEINNPLAGILTYAKLLVRRLDEGPLDETGRTASLKSLRLIERETERCTTIVRNLLDFARQRPLKIAEVDVRAVAEEALTLVQNQFTLKGVVIDNRLGEVPRVRADFGQLRQCFVNIALNACDATPPGGRLTITAAPSADGRAVEVAFADTGAGITPEKLARIFDPFFSTKEKGTGLGLSVVYGIVQRHGGDIAVDSAPGHGTTMRLRLPLEGPGAAEG